MAATSARAISYNLTSDHCTGGCGTPPFGTVTLTQVGTTVDVTVSLLDSNAWAITGSADFQLFKFNGTGVSLADISVDQTFAGETLAADTGLFNGDGTGNFLFGIECTTCGNGNTGISSDITFHVADATIADLTHSNNKGNIFVADLFSGTTGNTGPVDVTGTGTAPDGGATAALLGLGLAGLGGLRAKFGRK
jgi:hypothetical protein